MNIKGKFLFIALFLALFGASPGIASAKPVSPSDGRALFKSIFDPEKYFGFDYSGARADGSISIEELILTAKVSARDDYLPEYALAIAYHCKPDSEKEVGYVCGYTARMLRVKPDKEGSTVSNALKLVRSARAARGTRAKRKAFDRARLEWLEVSLFDDCKPAIEAMDELATTTDWQPSLHYTRIKLEHRDLILHPAQMWITMSGKARISRWQGWRNANGAAHGVNQLVGELDKCWKKPKSPPPWKIKK